MQGVIKIELIDDKIREILINLPSECAYIDYKVIPYSSNKCQDLVKDVIAMLNSIEARGHDKFIIFGITDSAKRVGIDEFLNSNIEKFDDSNYQSSFDKIYPRPHIQCGKIKFEGKTYGYIYIEDSLNKEKIYEINETVIGSRDNYKNVAYKGTAYTRKGSSNYLMMQEEREKVVEYNNINYSNFINYSQMSIGYSDLDDIMVAAIVGAWEDNNKLDISIIEEISQKKYSGWIKSLRELNNRNSKLISFDGNIWRISNQINLVKMVSKRIYNNHLELVKNQFIVLVENYNKKYDLPYDKRFAAETYNIEKNYSNGMISGLINFFAIISNNHDWFDNLTSNDISRISEQIISSVLLSKDWKRIATIKEHLSIFSEILPELFLDLTEKSLEDKQSSLYQFIIENEKAISVYNYGEDLIRALSCLAQIPKYFSKSCYCIFLMSIINPIYLKRLTYILLPWYPLTSAKSEQRIAIVKRFCNMCQDLSWNLVYSLLPNITTIGGENYYPKYIAYEKLKHEEVPKSYLKESKEYFKIATNLAVSNSRHACKLFELLGKFDPDIDNMILKLAKSFEKSNDDTKYELFSKLSEIFEKLENHNNNKNLFSKIKLCKKMLCPNDYILKNVRIFEQDYDYKYIFSGDEEVGWKNKVKSLRKDVINNCYDIGGIEYISKAIAVFESSLEIANILVESTFKAECDNELFDWLNSQNVKVSNVGRFYVSLRYNHWTEHEIISILTNHSPYTIATFLSCLNLNRTTINVAEQLLNEEVNLFWNQVNVLNIVDFKLSDIIIEKLLMANNIPQAIKLADFAIHMTNGVLNCELICSVLNSVKNDKKENINIDFHCVIDLIDYLEKNFFDTDKVIELEKKYFYVLKLHSKAPERLYECISKNPDVFIEFLKGGFKKTNMSKKILNEDEKKFAEFCFELLYNWKKVPGYSNNKLDVEYLKNWFYSVKEKSIQIDRYESAMAIIGAMLFHVPEDPSGLFMDPSVAKILDDEKKDSIRNAYACEVVNSRGVYFVDPTGRPEFELEKKYEKRATEIDELGFFRFAQTLRDIAKSFHFEAVSNIEQEKKWREV